MNIAHMQRAAATIDFLSNRMRILVYASVIDDFPHVCIRHDAAGIFGNLSYRVWALASVDASDELYVTLMRRTNHVSSVHIRQCNEMNLYR